MDRLTEGPNAPKDKKPKDFHTCWVCGKTHDDICRLRLFVEGDDNNVPEDGNYIIICRDEACWKIMEDHPRLYAEVRWGGVEAGALTLLCGDCDYREGFTCQHPDLAANGGEGLMAYASAPFGGAAIHVSYNDGSGGWLPRVFTECEGRTVNGEPKYRHGD